jgi:hypothetical protein
MAITNRDLDVSEQRQVLQAQVNSTIATGVSLMLWQVTTPCAAQAGAFAALGLSGSPQYMLNVLRWTSAGSTIIPLGISNITVSAAVGVSGAAQGWSGIRAAGSSLLVLQVGDAIMLSSAGTNAAAEKLAVALVVQKTSDIASQLGL